MPIMISSKNKQVQIISKEFEHSPLLFYGYKSNLTNLFYVEIDPVMENRNNNAS